MIGRRGLLVVGALLACSGAQRPSGPPRGPARAADFFPMRAGMGWSYDTATGIGGDTVLNTLAVEQADGDSFVIRSGTRHEHYERRSDGVQREGEYILHDPIRAGATWAGRGGGRFEIRAVEASRTVGEQSFREVIEVHRTSPDARLETTTWYARDVGAIEIVGESVSSIGGHLRVRSTLRGYTRADDTGTTR